MLSFFYLNGKINRIVFLSLLVIAQTKVLVKGGDFWGNQIKGLEAMKPNGRVRNWELKKVDSSNGPTNGDG